MSDDKDIELESWNRDLFKPGGGDAFLMYAVFGEFQQPLGCSRLDHRTEGVPEGLEVVVFSRDDIEHSEYMDGFLKGPGAEGLEHHDPELYEEITNAPHCLIVRGEIKDPPDLNYLRDTIGFLTALFEQGAVAIDDALRICWWDEQSWRECIFDPGRLTEFHVLTMYSEDEEANASESTQIDDEGSEEEGAGVLWWVHTRGLAKFGRPDISIRGVPKSSLDVAIEACVRFVEKMALGLVIEEGQEVRIPGLPVGMTWHHGGDYEDLDFNNVHVETHWVS